MPSTGEWMVLLVVGLLIFGRRLPEVGRSLARTMSQFRRGLQDFKQEMDKDEDLKEVKSTVKEFKKAIDAPRILANPGQFLDRLGEEPESSPDRVTEDHPATKDPITEDPVTEDPETEHQELAVQEPSSREEQAVQEPTSRETEGEGKP